MCAFCGLFSGQSGHWVERALGATDGSGAAPRAEGVRHRHRRLHEVRRALRHHRVELADFGGSAWTVTGATGASEVVAGLDEIWRAAERVSRRRLDPLDPDWIASLVPRDR